VGFREGPLEELAMTAAAAPAADFWRGKRVLVTGHTGFKGSWLTLWLHRLGASVAGISLAPDSNPNLFTLAHLGTLAEGDACDIRDAAAVALRVATAQPQIVFHLAAQALVRTGYREPLATFATNTQGTAHVLDALRSVASVRVVVAITTDKVYQNLEQAFPYRETDALGGHDPYSASKAAAEIVIASYRDAYLAAQGVAVGSARAGNVIGGGDWSADRLIPDAVRAWQSDQPLMIRRPDAIRPWQHVLEPLAGYLLQAERLWANSALAGAYNFGPQTSEAASVRHVIELAREAYGRGQVQWGDGSEGPHEAGWLALEVAKARTTLGVRARWPLAASVQRTMHWYRALGEGGDARQLCERDIVEYERACGLSPA
jgi:CDP-glucose 4,6-dehydratase